MVRTVRVRLELDRADYRQGLRDAAGDTRTFDSEVKSAGKDVSGLGTEAKTAGAQVESMGREVDTTAKKTTVLGDETDKTRKKTTGLGDDSDKTRTKVVQLAKDIEAATATLKAMGEEFRKTGQIDMGKFNDTSRTLRDLEKAKKELEKLGSTALKDGLNFGQMFSQGALKGIGRLYAEVPEVMVPLTALIAAGVGGAVTSGVLGVVGGGAIAVGIASQFSDPVVQNAVTQFGTWLSNQWHDVTSSFVSPLTAGLVHLQTDLGPALGQLKGAFATLAPYVENFAMYLGIAAQKLMPGLVDLLKSAGPALGAISRDLPALAHGASTFFEQISKGSKGGVEGLDAMIQAIGGILTVTGYLIRFLSDAYDAIIQFEDKFFGMMAKIPGLGKAFQPLADYIHHVATSFDDTGQSASNAGQAFGGFSGAAHDAAVKLNALEAAVSQYDTRQRDATMDLLSFKDALAQIGQQFQAGKDALNINTDAGRRNIEMVDEAKQKIRDHADEVLKSSGSAVQAAKAAQDYTAQLDAELRKAGATKDQIAQLNKMLDEAATYRKGTVDIEVNVKGNTAFLTNQGTTLIVGTGHKMMRYGGVEYAAEGMVTNRPTVVFGEAGVDEAFIPSAGISEARAASLIGTAMSWHPQATAALVGSLGRLPGAAPMVNVAAPSVDAGVLARAVASALQGVQVVLDGQAVGHIQGRQALLYTRGG